ncbi:PIN domain-containing protein [Sphingomonas sp. S1-29]|uniref:PIN domain-containing protein n=1 Tax=Sphingomonas sp. S1-29 TaxID=2991074 RepID=UPI00224091DC|nr:PIN domain-containing protein [Sphingomonas sp. S1-29]UZK69386.1 PIN domain-containing protein [Sphingomonas sp. S1-29]
MRMVVDANVVVSAVLGKRNPVAAALARGLELFIPEAQLDEAVRVVARLGDVGIGEARRLIADATAGFAFLQLQDLAEVEHSARARLEARGQSDWPVLAAAILLEGHIWSRDRDFFGVGVPVWSTRNIGFATA